jgi:hypothetical protein
VRKTGLLESVCATNNTDGLVLLFECFLCRNDWESCSPCRSINLYHQKEILVGTDLILGQQSPYCVAAAEVDCEKGILKMKYLRNKRKNPFVSKMALYISQCVRFRDPPQRSSEFMPRRFCIQ